MKKVLVLGAGGPAGVNFLRSLSSVNEEIELYGTDINPYHIVFAEPWTKETFIIPRATSPEYIPYLNEIKKKKKLNLFIPSLILKF